MTLLDKGADAARDQIDERGAEWLSKGLDDARGLLERLDPIERSIAAAALDAAERHEAGLADLGRAGLLVAVTWTGLGEQDKARRAWLASSATFQERRAASAASTEATEAETARREKAWAEFQAFAKEAGLTALRVVLPLLIAAVARP